MAMIKCPECGKDISDKAEKCLYCGCPNSELHRKDSDNKNNIEKSVNKHSIKLLLSIGLCIVVFVLAIVLITNRKRQNNFEQSNSTEQEELRLEQFKKDIQGYWDVDQYRRLHVVDNKVAYSIKEDVADEWPEYSEFVEFVPYIDEEHFCKFDVNDQYGDLIVSVKYKEGNLDGEDWQIEYADGRILETIHHWTEEEGERLAEEEKRKEDEIENQKYQEYIRDDANYKTSLMETDNLSEYDQYEFISPDGWEYSEEGNSRSYYNVNDKESKDIIYFFTEEVDYEGSIVDEENKDAYFADMSEENNIQNVKNIVIGDNINAVQYNSTIISDSGENYDVITTLIDGKESLISIYYAHAQDKKSDIAPYNQILDTLMIQIPRFDRSEGNLLKDEVGGVQYRYSDIWNRSATLNGYEYKFVNSYYIVNYYEYDETINNLDKVIDETKKIYNENGYEVTEDTDTNIQGKNAYYLEFGNGSSVAEYDTFIDLKDGYLQVCLQCSSKDTYYERYQALIRSLEFQDNR